MAPFEVLGRHGYGLDSGDGLWHWNAEPLFACDSGHSGKGVLWLLCGQVPIGEPGVEGLERGVHASNGELVSKAIRIIKELGGRTCSVDEARHKLGLSG